MNKKHPHDHSAYFIGLLLACIFIQRTSMASVDSHLHGVHDVSSALVYLSAVIGSVGSYLVFGDDKKFPPSATNVGHVLLGFGAGVFFSRGSLVLLGVENLSYDVVLLTAFLWAVMGYFILRLCVAILTHDGLKDSLTHVIGGWLSKIFGGIK